MGIANVEIKGVQRAKIKQEENCKRNIYLSAASNGDFSSNSGVRMDTYSLLAYVSSPNDPSDFLLIVDNPCVVSLSK